MFVDYVNSLKKVTQKQKKEIDLYSPDINKNVISLYEIMTEYSKKKKRVTVPVPDDISVVKTGNKVVTRFSFSNVEQSTVETVIEQKSINANIDTTKSGIVLEV